MNPGSYVLQCHVNDHIAAGMQLRYAVTPTPGLSALAGGGGAVRRAYIEALEAEWDYLPGDGRDGCSGAELTDAQKARARPRTLLVRRRRLPVRRASGARSRPHTRCCCKLHAAYSEQPHIACPCLPLTSHTLSPPLSDPAQLFTATTAATMGSLYKKARFVGHADAHFSAATRLDGPASSGLLGPLVQVEAGDTLRVTFRNSLSRGASLRMPPAFVRSRGPDAGTEVPAGGTVEYTWFVPPQAGPLPGEPLDAAVAYTYACGASRCAARPARRPGCPVAASCRSPACPSATFCKPVCSLLMRDAAMPNPPASPQASTRSR